MEKINFNNSYNILKKSTTSVDRIHILNIANNLNIRVKDGAIKIVSEGMLKKSGYNKRPNIVTIDKIFDGVNDENAVNFRKKAYELAMLLFRNKKVLIKDTNSIVQINKSGLSKTFSNDVRSSKIQSANKIEDIIKESIYCYTTYQDNNILFHHYFTLTRYLKKNQLIRIVIKEYPNNNTMVDKYYYHQMEIIVDLRQNKNELPTLPRKCGSKAPGSSSSSNITKIDNCVNT